MRACYTLPALPPSPPAPDPIDQLRDRWRAEPSSRGFLQVAEEYRRDGRVDEALAMLDEGLRQQPAYLAALVAKGRCHLELGQPEAAREALERVVRRDATQAVANKLLVRAHLAAGEPRQARERLELYGLLHGGDPEIQELKDRIRALERPGAPRRHAGADVFDLEPRAAPPPELLFPGERRVAAASSNGEPFAGLDTPEVRRRYLEGLVAEGIFAFDPPAPPPSSAPVPAPPAATVTLGQLYLEQGHAAEARDIFTEVLRREPDNRAARTALAAADGPPRGETPAARKAYALNRYLERLRRGSARLVP